MEKHLLCEVLRVWEGELCLWAGLLFPQNFFFLEIETVKNTEIPERRRALYSAGKNKEKY